MGNAATTSNEAFYLGVAWAHTNVAKQLVDELRAALPLNHRSQAGLRQVSTELGRVVAFRTATSPWDDRTVTHQYIDTLSIAHVEFVEARPGSDNAKWKAISSALVQARRAVERQEV